MCRDPLETTFSFHRGPPVVERCVTATNHHDRPAAGPSLLLAGVVEVNALAQGGLRRFAQWPEIEPFISEAATLPLSYCRPNFRLNVLLIDAFILLLCAMMRSFFFCAQ